MEKLETAEANTARPLLNRPQSIQSVQIMACQPKVSVIIPHYNDLSGLESCLDALDKQDFDGALFEIIVADNVSPVDRKTLERLVDGRARLVDATERGAGPARNAGAAVAAGEIFAFTDCDCAPEPGWLSAGVKELDKYDLVGGSMKVLVRDRGRMTAAEAFETVFAFNNRRYVLEEAFSITANLFCRRDVFKAVGPFRTGISEDKEWCLRARDAGYGIGYAQNAVVGHPAREDWPQLRKKWQRLMEESFVLAMESGMSRIFWLLRTWAVLLSILPHMIRVAFSQSLSGLQPRVAAIAMLVRIRLWRFYEGHRLLIAGGH